MAAPVVDSAAVRAACAAAADPALARQAVTAIVEAHPGVADELAAGGTLLDALVAVVVASRSLGAAIVADATLLDALREPSVGAPERSETGYREAVAAAVHAAAGTVAGGATDRHAPAGPAASGLRRAKRAELLAIAARDLLGRADLRRVGRELAALAAAGLDAALALAEPEVPLAVIGMGKLGGRELNYASDVDVLFVHDGDATAAERAARRVLAVMGEATDAGIVFRTDADLRPEGRSGALSRSLDAYEAYWERWAQTWEYQALLKSRAVAGDAGLGAEFRSRSERYVWPEVLDPDAVRDIRSMKARSESELRRHGTHDREVKRGRGGIRDIEFAVQLLQLVHGRHDPTVRSPTTLEALEALAAGGYVALRDAARLDEAYEWLRTVEHRIQLREERQDHTVPDDPAARDLLARVLGFRDRGDRRALDHFDDRRRAEQRTVRALHEQIFFQPLLDTLAGVGPMPSEKAAERLSAFGFRDVDQTRAALAELTTGLTRRSRVMAQLFPAILGWLSETPDPDLGLLQLRRLAEGYERSRTLGRRFRDTPVAAERACRILGSSRVLGLALHRQPDFLDDLADEDLLDPDRTSDPGELTAEALDALNWRVDDQGRQTGLRRFKRRHLLRIGARDLLGAADVDATGRELADLAGAALEAALRSLEPGLRFAVIGMGRLGGRELSYASDIDVLFVYDEPGAAAFDAATHVARGLMRVIGATTAEGQTFRIDADLRPEGRAGPLVRPLAGYVDYYDRWAEPWELQSLVRARPVAGDPALGARFVESVMPRVYRDPLPEESVREIRRIKARVEKERIPPGEDPQFHLKLGRGGLSDVEFTVQLLQLRHGARHPEVRDPSTHAALGALAARGLVDADDADVLAEAYDLCERARNHRYLLTGRLGDSLPVDGSEATQLGRMLGFTAHPQSALRDEYRRVTRRARAVVERVFYGQD